MTQVEVVNRQVIDGQEYTRGQVIDLPGGRARDLIAAGKARPAPPIQASAPAPAPAPVDPAPASADAKAKPKAASKETKNG